MQICLEKNNLSERKTHLLFLNLAPGLRFEVFKARICTSNGLCVRLILVQHMQSNFTSANITNGIKL